VKRNGFLIGALLLVAVATAACAGQGGTASDYSGIVDSLRGAGVTIASGGEVSQEFFSGKGQAIMVNGEQVQIFEYADESAAEANAASVSADGSTVGTTMITWIATPHFYRSGKVIVLYIGDDTAVLKALETVLGAQFAGR